MPASERRFSDPLPERLYLDTDILINHIVGTEPHHERCRGFLERLVHDGRTTIYLSPLSWMEFAYVISQERFRRALPEDQQRRYRLDRWGRSADVRRQYLQDMYGRLDLLLADFDWYEIPITTSVRIAAAALLAEYNIDGQDALHLACAAEEQITDVASLDRAFRHVDDLILWNDLIYTHPIARLGR